MAVQNIMLSGGTWMIPGFKARFMQEIQYLIQNLEEFDELKVLSHLIIIPDSCFPPNCKTWVGASLLSNLNTEIDKFLITLEDYNDNEKNIPDRFGEAFIFGYRKKNYFNEEFEKKFRKQKQILFSQATPFSSRSQLSRRPISQVLRDSMVKMMTPRNENDS
jgi:actin-related protein